MIACTLLLHDIVSQPDVSKKMQECAVCVKYLFSLNALWGVQVLIFLRFKFFCTNSCHPCETWTTQNG